MSGVRVVNLQLLVLDDEPRPAGALDTSDAAIVARLSRSLRTIRDDSNKVALLMTLFGRHWYEVAERLREIVDEAT